MKRDFLTLKDFSATELAATLTRAIELKKQVKSQKLEYHFKGRVLGMIFEKSSTRTRVSFEVAMNHLGGTAIYMNQEMSQIGRGETYADTARVLSRYVQALVFRTYDQSRLTELARYATIPVINGLTDLHHPCQVVADLVTLKERGLDLGKMIVSYVGDGNNMTHSWMEAADLLGFELRVATPKGFCVDETIKKSLSAKARVSYSYAATEAVSGCDVINTDTWFSMGQEVSDEKRAAFAAFQVNKDLLSLAKKDAIVLHCLPAHRGEEITDDVIDGKQSVVFDQAENRLYGQMAILELLMQ